MLHNLTSLLSASLTMFAALSTQAHADNFNSPESDSKDWQFELGAGVMYGPKYDGSDESEAKALPMASAEYKDGLFFANIWDGIGSYPIKGENYKLGGSIGSGHGRKESDDPKNLRGMGDIDSEVTATIKGEYMIGPVQISGEVTSGSESYGTTAKLELGSMIPVNEKLMMMGSVGPTWVDEKHMQSYFGVSAAQAARSGYSRYDAGSGVKSVGVNIGAVYKVSKNWDTMLMVSSDKLLNDAADSPITKKDSSSSVFFTASYKF